LTLILNRVDTFTATWDKRVAGLSKICMSTAV